MLNFLIFWDNGEVSVSFWTMVSGVEVNQVINTTNLMTILFVLSHIRIDKVKNLKSSPDNSLPDPRIAEYRTSKASYTQL